MRSEVARFGSEWRNRADNGSWAHSLRSERRSSGRKSATVARRWAF